MAPCSGCAVGNPIEARFCMSCGAPLERRCGACGALASDRARFCTDCGAEIATGGAVAEPGTASAGDEPVADASVPEAAQTLDERRTVAVLFADLSGYTAVAEKLDPESVKRLLERILRGLGGEGAPVGGAARHVSAVN